MTGQVGHVTTALCSLLDTVLEVDGQARTPPPSPSISGDSEDSANSMDGPGAFLTSSLLQAASHKVVAGGRRPSPLAPPALDHNSR